jgi:hypothetical protein
MATKNVKINKKVGWKRPIPFCWHVSADEKQWLKEEADRAGITVAEFLRRRVFPPKIERMAISEALSAKVR